MEEEDPGALMFDVNITNYYVVGNGSTYDKHFFTLTVTADGIQYTVDRTIVDFVYFDSRIRKKFPRTKFPELPIKAAPVIKKIIARDIVPKRRNSASAGGGSSASLTSPTSPMRQTQRDSLVGTKDLQGQGLNNALFKSMRIIEGDQVDARNGDLNKYIKRVIAMHEVLATDELLLFLDEEASSMFVDPDSLAPISVHDLLLLSEPCTTIIVSREEEVSFNVRQGQIVVWRFTTEYYDIGFSVKLGKEEKVAYTRYQSHEKPAMGTIEVNQPGICTLKWDNSYSKFRSKTLKWCYRIVTAEEFHAAKVQAMDVQREKRKFEMQRLPLKRVCVRQAAAASGVMHSTSVVHDQAEEEGLHIKEMEEEIIRLQSEVEALNADIESLQEELDECERAKVSAEESRDQISGSWRFTASQLDTAQTELRNLRKELVECQEKIRKESEVEISQLTEDLERIKELLQIAEDSERETSDACSQAVEAADVKINELLGQIDTLNQEKTTLQAELATITNSAAVAASEAVLAAANASKRIAEAKEEAETAKAIAANARSTADSSLATIHDLNSQIELLNSEFEEERQRKEEEFQRLVEECLDHKAVSLRLTSENNSIRSQAERYRTSLEAVQKEYEDFRASVESQRDLEHSKLTESEEQQSSANREIEELRNQLAIEMAEKETLEAERKAWEEKYHSSVSSSLAAAEIAADETNTLRETIGRLEQMLFEKTHALQEQAQTSEREMDALRRSMDQELWSMKQQMSSAQVVAAASAEASAIVAASEAAAAALTTASAEVQSQRQVQQMTLREMTGAKDQLIQTHAEYVALLQAELHSAKESASSSSAAAAAGAATIVSLSSELSSAKLSVVSLQEDIARLQSKLHGFDELQAENVALKQAVSRANSAQQHLESENERLLAEKHNWSHQQSDEASRLREILQQRDAELEQIKKQVRDQQASAEEQQGMLESLVQEHGAAEKRQSESIKQLQKRLEESSTRIKELEALLETRNDVPAATSTPLPPIPTPTVAATTTATTATATAAATTAVATTSVELGSLSPSITETRTISVGSLSPATMLKTTKSVSMSTENGTHLKMECLRLSAMLRAKEDLLQCQLKLYDEQSMQVADLSAQVGELQAKLEKVGDHSDQIERFKAAAGEISAALAFWLGDA